MVGCHGKNPGCPLGASGGGGSPSLTINKNKDTIPTNTRNWTVQTTREPGRPWASLRWDRSPGWHLNFSPGGPKGRTQLNHAKTPAHRKLCDKMLKLWQSAMQQWKTNTGDLLGLRKHGLHYFSKRLLILLLSSKQLLILHVIMNDWISQLRKIR